MKTKSSYFRKIIFLAFLIALIGCKGQNKKVDNVRETQDLINLDSLNIITSKFLWLNDYVNPKVYEVEEPDLNDFYRNNKELSLRYFPLILEKYNLTLSRKIIFYCYLYKLGEEKYIENLCDIELTDLEKLSLEQNLKNFNIVDPCR